MALQLNYTNAHNQQYTQAYAVVNQFWGNSSIIYVDVFFYESILSKQNNEKEIDRLTFKFPYTDKIGITDIYNLLKQEQLFANAEDV